MQHNAGISKKLWTNSCQVGCRGISWYLSQKALPHPCFLISSKCLLTGTYLSYSQQHQAGTCPAWGAAWTKSCNPIIHWAGSDDSDNPGADCNQTVPHLGIPVTGLVLKRHDCLLLKELLQREGEDLACFLYPWRQHSEWLAAFTTDVWTGIPQ